MTTDAATLLERLLSAQAELVRQVQALTPRSAGCTTASRRLHRRTGAGHARRNGWSGVHRRRTAGLQPAHGLHRRAPGRAADGPHRAQCRQAAGSSADKATEDGLVLRRVGADRAGAIWCVIRDSLTRFVMAPPAGVRRRCRHEHHTTSTADPCARHRPELASSTARLAGTVTSRRHASACRAWCARWPPSAACMTASSARSAAAPPPSPASRSTATAAGCRSAH